MAPQLPLCCSSNGFDLLKRQLPVLNSPDALLQGAIAIAMHQIDDVDPAHVDAQIQGYVDRRDPKLRMAPQTVHETTMQFKLEEQL